MYASSGANGQQFLRCPVGNPQTMPSALKNTTKMDSVRLHTEIRPKRAKQIFGSAELIILNQEN